MSPDRIYLYVPPEDKAQVEALGAQWDAESACWYIGVSEDQSRFAEWLPGADAGGQDEEFSIVSDEAYVASAAVTCCKCGQPTEVICMYCESGTVLDVPLEKFTVSNITAMDSALAEQLGAWKTFKRVQAEGREERYFANHCANCGAAQEEERLRSEPEDVFFHVAGASGGGVTLTKLRGPIQLTGDESFEI